MEVIKLTSERVWRTYTGGSMIDKLHGIEFSSDTHFPEEWIMSTTSARNPGREHITGEGLSRDATTQKSLKELINENPAGMLGQMHFNKFKTDTGVLVKIIDSSERLSIQVHPDKASAKKLFNSNYGKTECWHILGGRTVNGSAPCIYLGFKEGITRERWKDIFTKQDIPLMLDCLHKIQVKPKDTFLIPGGVPHAIGSGCFLIEIQEPTDYTVRTELTTTSGFKISDEMCHQGIGFEKMFDCFIYDGKSLEKTIKSYKVSPSYLNGITHIVGYNNTPCFKMDLIDVYSRFEAPAEKTFKGLYVIEGEGYMEYSGKSIKIRQSDQFFIPAGTNIAYLPAARLQIIHIYGPKI